MKLVSAKKQFMDTNIETLKSMFTFLLIAE